MLAMILWALLSARPRSKELVEVSTIDKPATPPAIDLSHLADPACDHFWPESSGRFQVRCGPDVYSDNILVGNIPARYLQAEISIKSGTVHGCKAYLREISGGTRHWKGHEQLTFQPSESPDTLSKAIYEKIKYRLDVLLLISTGGILICNHNRIWASFPWPNDLFAAQESYDLTVDVGGENAAGETFLLRFNWTGELANIIPNRS